MKVTPIPGEPGLFIEPTTNKEKERASTVVIADVHLGIESTLVWSGIRMPSQMEVKLKRLLGLVKRTRPDRLVILGDLKHRVTGPSYQEREEVPRFLKGVLAKVATVDIVIGNHDSGLKELVPEGVSLHPELVIEDVGLAHGHSWPSGEVMGCQTVVIAHNHSTILFLDELGQRTFHHCWIRADVDLGKAGKRYKDIGAKATGIVVPAFEHISTGTPFNLEGMPLLGPLLANGVFGRETAKAYLLDGTYLGQISELLVKDPDMLRQKRQELTNGFWTGGKEGEQDR